MESNLRAFRGLDGTQLKTLAAVLMLLDHIGYFFAFMGRVPGAFSAVGHLAAPLFLFCLAEGFSHTHSRGRYFLRIWLLGAAMGGVRFFMQFAGFAVRGDGFYPQNSILSAYALLLVFWRGIDLVRARRILLGAALMLAPALWPFAANALWRLLPAGAEPFAGFACWTLLPLWNTTGDTSLPVMVAGVLIYALRGRRRAQAAGFAAWTVFYHFFLVWQMASAMPGFAPMQMLTRYNEWLGAFAAIPMLCYNGKRGAGRRAFFYAFYPAHVYILYALSCAVYAMGG